MTSAISGPELSSNLHKSSAQLVFVVAVVIAVAAAAVAAVAVAAVAVDCRTVNSDNFAVVAVIFSFIQSKMIANGHLSLLKSYPNWPQLSFIALLPASTAAVAAVVVVVVVAASVSLAKLLHCLCCWSYCCCCHCCCCHC